MLRTLACLGLTVIACHPAPVRDLPVCPSLVTATRATESDTRVLPPVLWLSLLVPSFDRSTGEVRDDATDCSRREVLEDHERPLPGRARTGDDLSFATTRDGAVLVWARLFEFPDGTARGPVVLAHWVDHGLEIRGVGSLRAPARRVRLRLEHLPGDHRLLVAEGEACAVDAATPCPRSAVLLPLVDQRFLVADLVEGDEPPRPALLRLDEAHEQTRNDGSIRRLEVHRRLELTSETPSLHALIQVHDCQPDATCHEHLSLLDTRPLELAGLTFITATDPSRALLQPFTQ